MLQRIQTVYLVLAIIIIVLSTVLPIAFYSNLIEAKQFEYSIINFLSNNPHTSGFNSIPLIIPAMLSILMALIAIFQFKKRKLQQNLVVYSLISNVLYVIILVYYFLSVFSISTFGDVNISYKLPVIFPFVSIILIMLALRGIKNDEKLVKSLDRLR